MCANLCAIIIIIIINQIYKAQYHLGPLMRYVGRNSSMLACQLIVNTTKEKCLEMSSESVT